MKLDRFDVRELQAVQKVIESGKLSQFFKSWRGGEQIQAFEEEFARYLSVGHAISVCNGTVSLEIALKALDIGKGDEVITTPLSFIATGTAILAAGATPVFADIRPETLNISIKEIERNITSRTKAILPVSLLGYPADMPEIMNLANALGLAVVEDAAQALGARINQKKIGSFGDLGSFSFQESKQITTLGEGGMIVTDSEKLAERCRNIRNHGNYYGNLTDCVSTNARMTEAQAAFGRVQMEKLEMFNKIQIENAEYFLSHVRPPLCKVYSVFDVHNLPQGYKPIYLLVGVYLDDNSPLSREQIVAHLTTEGVSQGDPGRNVGYYKTLIYQTPIFEQHHPNRLTEMGTFRPKCPMAEWALEHLMIFDIHRWCTKDRVQQDLDVITELFNKKMESES